MNSTVSRPSRATEMNARAASATIDPPTRAPSTPRSSSDFRPRPCRRIQNSIHVSTITAASEAIPPMASWTTNGSSPIVALAMPATASDRITAAATPIQTPLRASFRPTLTR